MKLSRAVVLDSWRSERKRASELCSALDDRLDEIRGRIEAVEDAFLFESAIDQQTDDRQLAKLREELMLVEIQRNDAHFEQIDKGGDRVC